MTTVVIYYYYYYYYFYYLFFCRPKDVTSPWIGEPGVVSPKNSKAARVSLRLMGTSEEPAGEPNALLQMGLGGEEREREVANERLKVVQQDERSLAQYVLRMHFDQEQVGLKNPTRFIRFERTQRMKEY